LRYISFLKQGCVGRSAGENALLFGRKRKEIKAYGERS